jgi:hypothetical protein
MNLLLVFILLLCFVALALYAIRKLIPDPMLANILTVIVVVVAAVYALQRFYPVHL